MSLLKLYNDHEGPCQLMLEPSGHCFEMPAGSVFEVLPHRHRELEIHQLGTDLMIVGAVAKVIHNGKELASWDESSPTTSEPRPGRVAGIEDVKRHLTESGENISANPEGAMVFRQVAGKSWIVGVQWRAAQQVVHVEAPLGFDAPLERERDLALTITRIHIGNAIPGFQILRTKSSDKLDLTYWVVLMLDEEHKLATTVLDRAIAVCIDMVTRYADRLAAVAQGKPDPGIP